MNLRGVGVVAQSCFLKLARSEHVPIVRDPSVLADLAAQGPPLGGSCHACRRDEGCGIDKLWTCPECGEQFCDMQCSRRGPCPHLEVTLGAWEVSCMEVLSGEGCTCSCCQSLLPPFCNVCQDMDCCDMWRSMYGSSCSSYQMMIPMSERTPLSSNFALTVDVI